MVFVAQIELKRMWIKGKDGFLTSSGFTDTNYVSFLDLRNL